MGRLTGLKVWVPSLRQVGAFERVSGILDGRNKVVASFQGGKLEGIIIDDNSTVDQQILDEIRDFYSLTSRIRADMMARKD